MNFLKGGPQEEGIVEKFLFQKLKSLGMESFISETDMMTMILVMVSPGA